MFINSKKSFEVREGDAIFVIPRNYIGEIPNWVASHWMIQAAINDGSIATPENTADKFMERADMKAEEKAERIDPRPDEPGTEDILTEPSKDKGKGKSGQ